MIRTIAILTLLFTVSAANAQYMLLPKVFAVTGVASNDTLNVRQAPDAGAADIGDLHPDQRVEVIARNEDKKWGQIIWGETNGWVSMRYLTPAPLSELAPSGLPLGIACTGTEPFWLAEFTPAGMLDYSDISTVEDIYYSSPITLAARSINDGRGSYAFSAGLLNGILRRATCYDGMSNVDFGWALDLVFQSNDAFELRSGCCRASLN